MLGMAKRVAESGRVRRSSRIGFLIVADAASRQVAAVGLRVRGVATVTTVVRGETNRNRERCALPQRPAVARNTTIRRPGRASHVLGVIKFDVEALVEAIRKGLARWIAHVHVLVTDRAHRQCRRSELAEVAAGAGFVTRETRAGRVVRSPVAVVAAQRSVLLT